VRDINTFLAGEEGQRFIKTRLIAKKKDEEWRVAFESKDDFEAAELLVENEKRLRACGIAMVYEASKRVP
jgi:hypothetical protein